MKMNQTKQSNTNLFAKNKQKPPKPKRNTINLFCCCCCFFSSRFYCSCYSSSYFHSQMLATVPGSSLTKWAELLQNAFTTADRTAPFSPPRLSCFWLLLWIAPPKQPSPYHGAPETTPTESKPQESTTGLKNTEERRQPAVYPQTLIKCKAVNTPP